MPESRQVTLTLETLTPLFLGGADPRGAPELRVPSLRGVLRYWLRAALGGVIGDRNLKALNESESKVFGSTGNSSNIVLHLSHGGLNPVPFKKQHTQYADDGKPKPSGRDYLFWSMAESGRAERGNYIGPKQALPEGSRFDLTVALRTGSTEAFALFEAQAALWLFVQLGGLGSRARRTGGSLRVIEPMNTANLPSFAAPETSQELATLLGQGFAMIRQELMKIEPTHAEPTVPARFDILHPRTCHIWILTDSKPWSDSAEAVEAIGSSLRDFRSYRKPDHDTVREWLDGGKKPLTIERAAFGLPLPFRYSNRGPDDVLQGHDHDRRTSPLSLRVSRLASGQFVGVAVLFESELLPRGETIQFQRSKRETVPPKNYELLRQFIAEKFTAVEVKL